MNPILKPDITNTLQSQEDLLRSILDILKELLRRLSAGAGAASSPAGGIRLLDSFDLRTLLKICPTTLRAIKRRKELAPVRIAGRDYYLESDILQKFHP